MTTFTVKAINSVTGEFVTESATFGAKPAFGFNSSLDGGLTAAASTLGCKSFTTAKIFNSSIPASYPGHTGIPSSVKYPLVTIRVALTTSSPWISSADQASLAAVYKSMPVTGIPMVTINNEAEGAAHGYTTAQIIGSHNTSYNIFKANAPANAIYTQNLMTYSASSGGRGSNFHSWVFCKASGGVDLPVYFLDWYPTSSTTSAANSIIPAFNGIKSLVPSAQIGIGENNWIASSQSTGYAAGQLAWFKDSWAWAVSNNLAYYIAFFYAADNKPFPPTDPAVTAELSSIAHDSGL